MSPLPASLSPWPRRLRWLVALVVVLLVVVSVVLAWSSTQRVRKVEQEIVRRLQANEGLSAEARLFSKAADDSARESAAKVALLEMRLAEVAVQRTQLEDLMHSLSRSRDESLVIDIDAGLRVAQQQSAITGSAEPLVAALKQADERLARYGQVRLDGVRRAIARDLDRIKAVAVPDIPVLSVKLDEVIRLVDDLPLLSQAARMMDPAHPAEAAPAASTPASAAAPSSLDGWATALGERWDRFTERIWGETRALVRVTRIDQPDAMLLAPEQAFFLRENLKLRLLNARLALLSRQFDMVQSDLQASQHMLARYFDPGSRRHGIANDLIQQVAGGARSVALPRPDDTLAALSSVSTPGR